MKLFANSHKTMMVICCIAMIAGAYLIFRGSSSFGSFEILLPLVICVGMHFVMHKMMGGDGHKTRNDEENNGAQEQVSSNLNQSPKHVPSAKP